MKKPGDQLVSCLMVSTGNDLRFPLMQRSIEAYCRQSYTSKELVILLDNPTRDHQARVESHLARLNRRDLRLTTCQGRRSLGALRNACVAEARGALLCQWDDDDVSHPQRIARQTAHLVAENADAVVLRHCLHYFAPDRIGYWVNWGRTRMQGHPATLLMKNGERARYLEDGQTAQLGEGGALLARLRETSQVRSLSASASLYAYVFHGGNTCPLQHHLMLARRFCESRDVFLRQDLALLAGLRDLHLHAEGIDLFDAKGRIFTFAPPSIELAR